MARQPLVAKRAEELLGSAVVATSPVAGGDIATATRIESIAKTMSVIQIQGGKPLVVYPPR